MSDSELYNPASLARAWSAVLGQLEVELNRPVFETWVRGTRLLSVDSATALATIEAGSSFACANLQDRLALVILRALQTRLAGIHDIRFIEPGLATGSVAVSLAPLPPSRNGRLVGALNCEFTLDSYLPAGGNQLARSSCLALLSRSNERVSPVVVFAPPGLGKSHLLHALSSEAVRRGMNVACLNAEQFANHYLGAVRRDGIEDFHQSVRSVDLFVLDDLQYLAGKKATANELVHTIDAVTTAGGSVLVASECSPLELGLPDRLLSRLAAGLLTRIEPFDRETRMRFVYEATALAGQQLPQWAVERITSIDGLSVRTLQGVARNSVMLARNARLTHGELDLVLMHAALLANLPAARTPRDVIEDIARHFSTSFDDVLSRSRQGAVTSARAVVAFVLQERGHSHSGIAEILGKRERTTIRDLALRGQRLVAEDPELQRRFSA